MTLSALVAVLALAAGASARTPGRPARSVSLEWVGDIAMSTERGLPPGGHGRRVEVQVAADERVFRLPGAAELRVRTAQRRL
jgi:hypothetical protein